MDYLKMTDEEFQGIYTSEKLRNEVAFAHRCCASGGEFKYYGTCTYPNENRRQVTIDQIKESKRVRDIATWQTLKENHNKLLFVGMGMNYEARYDDDVCNYRIRTEFINDAGKTFFVEFGTGRGDEMRCDHSIDRNYEMTHESKRNYFFHLWRGLDKSGKKIEAQEARAEFKKYDTQPYYNYGELERRSSMPKYTKENVIRLVNQTFGCSFTEMVVDYYNLSCEGIMCVSPGFELEPVKA